MVTRTIQPILEFWDGQRVAEIIASVSPFHYFRNAQSTQWQSLETALVPTEEVWKTRCQFLQVFFAYILHLFRQIPNFPITFEGKTQTTRLLLNVILSVCRKGWNFHVPFWRTVTSGVCRKSDVTSKYYSTSRRAVATLVLDRGDSGE